MEVFIHNGSVIDYVYEPVNSRRGSIEPAIFMHSEDGSIIPVRYQTKTKLYTKVIYDGASGMVVVPGFFFDSYLYAGRIGDTEYWGITFRSLR